MPNKSVLGHPDNVPSLAREGFNLDQVFTFTASCGMILPSWYDIVYPGETIKGSPNFLLRTNAFLAPAMADVDCFVDMFFVPMRKIMSQFGEWFHQIDDISSDFNTQSGFTDHLPYIVSQNDTVNPFADFAQSHFDAYSYADQRNPLTTRDFDKYGFGMYRLLFHLGRNPQALFYGAWKSNGFQDEVSPSGILNEYIDWNKDLSSPNYSPYLECAYQAIYMDYFRNSEYEGNDIKSYNLDSFFNDGSGSIVNPFAASSGRKGMFELRYRWRSKDYFTASSLSPLISSFGMMNSNSGIYNLGKVNQWLQQGAYRPFNSSGNYPVSFDDPASGATTYGFVQPTLGTATVSLSGSASLSGTTGNDLDKWSIISGSLSTGDHIIGINHGTSGNNLGSVDSNGQNHGMVHSHDISGTASLSSSGTASVNAQTVLTTARIRTVFALEKLARVTQRAGKHYDDQTLAHFGFKVPQGYSNEVVKIGSWHTPLGIQKVTSTAGTQDAALGEQAGVGYALLDGSKKNVKFTAPCEGIVMCVWSCAPRYKYLVHHDKLGYKFSLWDFYKPELDNLGKQPLFTYECSNSPDSLQRLSAAVHGWQWRFMESKVKFDRVSPVFTTVTKNPWSMVADPMTYMDQGLVSPKDMNRLFNTQYDVAPAWVVSGTQQDRQTSIVNFPVTFLRDPFTIDFFMNVTKVSTMSTFGDMPLNGI